MVCDGWMNGRVDGMKLTESQIRDVWVQEEREIDSIENRLKLKLIVHLRVQLHLPLDQDVCSESNRSDSV